MLLCSFGPRLGQIHSIVMPPQARYMFFAVSHHAAVVARDVGVPGVVVPRHRLPVHQLADAASQGTHGKRPWYTLRWDAVDGLAFGL